MDKIKLYRRLRMISGIIAACMLVAIVFVYVYAGLLISVLFTCVLLVFVGLCFLFRHLQRKEEARINPPPPKGDFIKGRVPSLPAEFGEPSDGEECGTSEHDEEDGTSGER